MENIEAKKIELKKKFWVARNAYTELLNSLEVEESPLEAIRMAEKSEEFKALCNAREECSLFGIVL